MCPGVNASALAGGTVFDCWKRGGGGNIGVGEQGNEEGTLSSPLGRVGCNGTPIPPLDNSHHGNVSLFDSGQWDGILTTIVQEADWRREQLLIVEGSILFLAVISVMCRRACHLMKTITRASVQSFKSILAITPSVLTPLPNSPTSVADNTTCCTF